MLHLVVLQVQSNGTSGIINSFSVYTKKNAVFSFHHIPL